MIELVLEEDGSETCTGEDIGLMGAGQEDDGEAANAAWLNEDCGLL